MQTHRVDVVALVVGVVTLLATGGWALWWTGTLPGDWYAWLVPLGLVVAGVAGILASLWQPERPGVELANEQDQAV